MAKSIALGRFRSLRQLPSALVAWAKAWPRRVHPARLAIVGYLSYMVIGWLLLCIPASQARPGGLSALDNLFTAASALSTTGLVTVSLGDDYTRFGQIVTLVLIQLGGIGYMTIGSFLVLSTGARLSKVRNDIGRTVFSLPESFQIDRFLVNVIVFTAIIELAGAVALYPILAAAGEPSPLWSAVFHSISAFCTAGFSLYNTSFEAYTGDFWLNAVISVLSFAGAIGFIVIVDYWRWLRGKMVQVTLTSKIIIASSIWLTVIGTALLFLNEPALQGMPTEQRLMAAFFQSMTSMTTVGFDTVPIGTLSKGTILVLTVLMIVGASPSGTGGGLKSTTCSALWGVMRSTFRGESEVRFWGKPIPVARIYAAVASLGLYVIMLLAGTYILEITQSAKFEQNLFEAASALGTVGLSTGITAALTPLGKLAVILLMFLGRLGPLTFGMALFFRTPGEIMASDGDLAV